MCGRKGCGEKEHKCNVCGLSFRLKSRLTPHMEIHKDSYDYQCEKCQKRFKTKKCLGMHMKVHESREFKCDLCEKIFKSSLSLKSHKDQIHTHFAGFKCPECFKSYKQKRMFIQHTKAVHSPKKFKCNECDKHYAFQYVLNEHVKEKHTKREIVKTFECSICNKMFARNSELTTHAKNHEEPKIPCGVCNRKVKTEKSLKEHMLIHRKETPYKCNTCEKLFNNSGSLYRHMGACNNIKSQESIKMSTVLNEIVKICDICAFTSSSKEIEVLQRVFDYHMRTTHPDMPQLKIEKAEPDAGLCHGDV